MSNPHFISYSSADAQEFALKLANALIVGPPSFPVWLDKRELHPGGDWDSQLVKAIKSCESMIFVMSRDSVEDELVCKQEWTRAFRYKKAVTPILLHRDAEMPFRFGARHVIDFTGDFTIALARLQNHLQWLASPEGYLQALADRLADAVRNQRRANDPHDQQRIADEIALLHQQIAAQERAIANPQAVAEAAQTRIEAGLERERKPERPMEGKERSKFINQPPDSAPSYFQDGSPRSQLTIGGSGVGMSVRLQMEYLPTAIYHLFDSEEQPLLECAIATDSRMKRFLRVSSYIEGYSAQDVCTLELEKKDDIKIIKLLPALFSERIRSVSELTRAMLNVKIKDLESGKVIEHRALPLWLLARNSAPLAVKNPTTGKWDELSHYYAAFVTPNQEDVMSFLRQAVEVQTKRKFVGYVPGQPVRPQVEALYNILQQKSGIRYVNSIINFNLDESASSQRVRLPRETLEDKVANCIDGVLLFASLLEAISLNPAIVLIPGHALLAWETGEGNNRWEYLETTMLGENKTFDEACEHATDMAELSEQQQEAATQAGRGEELWFRRLSLHELRTKRRITPME